MSPPRANPQRNGAGPAMQTVRLVKALKLRLHGRHRHTQLFRDLLNPEIAGSKVKDLRLAPRDLNS